MRHSAITIYALALAPLSHVAALHETSVLFGALIGALFLNERFGVVRTAAAVVIVLGRVLMNGPTVFEPFRALARRRLRFHCITKTQIVTSRPPHGR